MYIVNFGCVLVFMTGILKILIFLKIFEFFQKISHKKIKIDSI